MRKLFILGLFSFSIHSYSLTAQDVGEIYQQLVDKGDIQNAPTINITSSDSVTAGYRSFDNSIMVTKGSVSIMNRNEMAFVLLHELGHFTMQTGGTWDSEMDADQWASIKGRKMGFNMCKGVKILKIFQQDTEHPAGAMRYNTVKCKLK